MKSRYIAALLMLLLWGGAARAGQPLPVGSVIFAAYPDSNQDGVIDPATDTLSIIHYSPATTQFFVLGSASPIPPATNPDGTLVAFIDAAGRLNAGALTGPMRLLPGEGISAFTWLDNRRVAYRSTALYLAYVDTGTAIQLTGPNLEPDTVLSVAGERIFFTQTLVDTNRSGGIGLPGDTNRLYAADLTTGEILALTDGTFRVESPRPSPDGLRLAYIRVTDSNFDGRYAETDVRQLWLSDTGGANPRRLSPEEAVGAEGIIWNAGGTHILFVHQPDLDLNGQRSEGDPRILARVEAGNGMLAELTQTAAIFQLRASPNGEWFAYVAVTADTNNDGAINQADTPNLGVVRMNEGTPTVLNPVGVSPSGALAFRGAQLAFAGDDGGLYLPELPAVAPDPRAEFLRLGQMAWAGENLLVSIDTETDLGVLAQVDPRNGVVNLLTGANLRLELGYPILAVGY